MPYIQQLLPRSPSAPLHFEHCKSFVIRLATFLCHLFLLDPNVCREEQPRSIHHGACKRARPRLVDHKYLCDTCKSALLMIDRSNRLTQVKSVFYFLGKAVYDVFFGPLSHIPGPKTNALSRIPYVRHLLRGTTNDNVRRTPRMHLQPSGTASDLGLFT